MIKRATAISLALAIALGGSLVYLSVSGQLTYAADDYWHISAMRGEGYPGGPGPDNLFRFFSGDKEKNEQARVEGAFPWYADTEIQVSFWRPLTTALHRLDFWLFGGGATAAKIHGLLWYLSISASGISASPSLIERRSRYASSATPEPWPATRASSPPGSTASSPPLITICEPPPLRPCD